MSFSEYVTKVRMDIAENLLKPVRYQSNRSTMKWALMTTTILYGFSRNTKA
jgi:hypothetical protein